MSRSSDEEVDAVGESGERIKALRAKTLPWRSKWCTKLFDALDKQWRERTDKKSTHIKRVRRVERVPESKSARPRPNKIKEGWAFTD